MRFGNSPSRGGINHVAERVYDAEDGKKLVIAIDVPGYEKDDIRARYQTDHVVVRIGNDKRSRPEIEQRIPTPDGADVKGTRAAFNNGVLTLTIPITEGPQADLL